jgi:hypothetical protein
MVGLGEIFASAAAAEKIAMKKLNYSEKITAAAINWDVD